MRGNTKTPGASTSSNGRQAAEGHVSVSHATRYLSVAPHLRRGMFRREITEPGLIGGRPPRPVGRSYAIRVRYGADGAVPMPAVDTEEVRKQCAIALLQTIIRDAAVLAVVITSAVLEPRGTAIVFGFTIAVIMLIGRVRLFSLWTIAAIVAGAVLLFTGIYRGELFLGIPLICLGACFVIYLADTVLSVYQVRRLWRKSAAGEKSGLRLPWAAPSGQAADGDKPDHAHLDDRSDGQSNTNGSGLTRGKLPVSEARLVYHDNQESSGQALLSGRWTSP